jgi:lipopolysaccharide transport system permease protein
LHELVIAAGGNQRQYWRDLWRYRELLYFLAWRDILVRYKQTVAGVSWAVIRPLLTMVVLTVVFGTLAKMPDGGVPYPLLVFCGMLPWQFVATAIAESGNSLITNAPLISKVYFPRLAIPVSSLVTSLVDLLVSGAMLALLMAWFGVAPGPRVLFVPLFLLMAIATAFALGVWLSALTVKYRDFRFIVPFIVQFGVYISPVGFTSDVVPGEWRRVYALNPMVGVIDGFRWSLLGRSTLDLTSLLISVAIVIALLATGVRYFRQTERTFADLI